MASIFDRPNEMHISDAEYARLGKTSAFVANFLVGRLRAKGGSEHPGQLAEAFKFCYEVTPKRFMGLGASQNYLDHLAMSGCGKYLKYGVDYVHLTEAAETLPDAGPSRGSQGDRTLKRPESAQSWCQLDVAPWRAPAELGLQPAAPPAQSSPPSVAASAVSAAAADLYELNPAELQRLQRMGGSVLTTVAFIIRYLSKEQALSADWSVLGSAFALQHGQTFREALHIGNKQNILDWLHRAGCTYLCEDSGVVMLIAQHHAIQAASSQPAVQKQDTPAPETPQGVAPVRTPAQLQTVVDTWRQLRKTQLWPVQLLLPLLQGAPHNRSVTWLLCALAPEYGLGTQSGHVPQRQYALDVQSLVESYGGRALLKELLMEQPALRIGYAPLPVQPSRRRRNAEWLWSVLEPLQESAPRASSSGVSAAAGTQESQPVCCWDMSDHRSESALSSGTAYCFDDCSAVVQILKAGGRSVDDSLPGAVFDEWMRQLQPHSSKLDAIAASALLQCSYDGIVRDGAHQMRSGGVTPRMLQQAVAIPGLVFAGGAEEHDSDGVSAAFQGAQVAAMAAAYHSWRLRLGEGGGGAASAAAEPSPASSPPAAASATTHEQSSVHSTQWPPFSSRASLWQ